jgi:tRNA(Ile)-lysidine synthase
MTAAGPTDQAPAWSADHLRLHRHLRRQPSLLPTGVPLLLSVSGGQDSMAMTGLLADLRRLHGWSLTLWHGDHGWRPESGRQAKELAAWAAGEGLPLVLERAQPAPPCEDQARQWRYRRLAELAALRGISHVVTGHTATDRAETVLLNLARGSHRRGLASLRPSRPLHNDPGGSPQLVRPLLHFCRDDTARICHSRGLPIWLDSSNDDRRYGRNRLRAEVLPVLEALYPGAQRRMSLQAERLAQEDEQHQQLVAMALRALTFGDFALGNLVLGNLVLGDLALGAQEQLGPVPAALDRRGLGQLAAANQRALIQLWLRQQGPGELAATALETLLAALRPEQGPGQMTLAAGWRLGWDRCKLHLIPPASASP